MTSIPLSSLLEEFHPSKNTVTPDSLKPSSGYKVWWLASCGHEWEATVAHRTRGSGCPYCSNSKVLKGFNDLASQHPEFLPSWDYDKNMVAPEELTSKSGQKVWWKCSLSHSWEATVQSRVLQGTGCPYCAGRKVLAGFNDLATTHPDLAKKWHPSKNVKSPEEITAGSKQKVWWRCVKDHEWEATVKSLKHGRGCPYCANKKILPGKNDLASTHPLLCEEWDKEANLPNSPSDYTYGSDVVVWWKCEAAHKWEARISDRTKGKSTGCPKCKTYQSAAEKEIYEYFSALTLCEASNREVIPPYELDLYFPDQKIAVEFNGLYWHSEAGGKLKTYHHDKWLQCKNKGIQLIQIWEDEWMDNPEQVKRMLTNKLGISTSRKVPARKTNIVKLTNETTLTFLRKHHIQGGVEGSIRVGLEYQNELVAVMVLKHEAGSEGKELNLLRFATSTIVQGGFTKLLKYVERTYQPHAVITFSDNCVSDGSLYKENGFTAVAEIEPDYMYVTGEKRHHKFGYRLKRFKTDPKLKYEEGLTERELASLNNLHRIWDAGKIKWRIEYDNLTSQADSTILVEEGTQ